MLASKRCSRRLLNVKSSYKLLGPALDGLGSFEWFAV